MDGSLAICNGFLHVHPSAKPVQCYPHAARRLEDAEYRFKSPGGRAESPSSGFAAFLDICKNGLAMSRTVEQFDAMATGLHQQLEEHGEHAMAAHFLKWFATGNLRMWFYAAGSTRGKCFLRLRPDFRLVRQNCDCNCCLLGGVLLDWFPTLPVTMCT
jgi:hypothetical protein